MPSGVGVRLPLLAPKDNAQNVNTSDTVSAQPPSSSRHCGGSGGAPLDNSDTPSEQVQDSVLHESIVPGLRGRPHSTCHIDAELDAVIDAWPKLKERVRRVIVELATTPANGAMVNQEGGT